MAKGKKRGIGCLLVGCLTLVVLAGGVTLTVFLVAGAGGFAYWYEVVGGHAPQSIHLSALPAPVPAPAPSAPGSTGTAGKPASAPSEAPSSGGTAEAAPAPAPPAPAPAPKAAPAPEPAPAPEAAPAPKPAPRPKPAPTHHRAPTPRPTTMTRPAPSSTPNVTVEGKAKVVLIAASGKRYSVPGTVPAGTYEIEATFSDGVPVKVGKMRVEEGGTATVRCNEAMGICRGE